MRARYQVDLQVQTRRGRIEMGEKKKERDTRERETERQQPNGYQRKTGTDEDMVGLTDTIKQRQIRDQEIAKTESRRTINKLRLPTNSEWWREVSVQKHGCEVLIKAYNEGSELEDETCKEKRIRKVREPIGSQGPCGGLRSAI